MTSTLNLAEVPVVDASDLGFVLQMLIEDGQGLALLRGLKEAEIRAIEGEIWANFQGSNQTRLALALRFRALLDVFSSRRLKALFLERGFRIFAAVAHEAARRPLNVRFGFNSQRMLLALDALTAGPVNIMHAEEVTLAIAA
jgi:hypothetical protein